MLARHEEERLELPRPRGRFGVLFACGRSNRDEALARFLCNSKYDWITSLLSSSGSVMASQSARMRDDFCAQVRDDRARMESIAERIVVAPGRNLLECRGYLLQRRIEHFFKGEIGDHEPGRYKSGSGQSFHFRQIRRFPSRERGQLEAAVLGTGNAPALCPPAHTSSKEDKRHRIPIHNPAIFGARSHEVGNPFQPAIFMAQPGDALLPGIERGTGILHPREEEFFQPPARHPFDLAGKTVIRPGRLDAAFLQRSPSSSQRLMSPDDIEAQLENLPQKGGEGEVLSSFPASVLEAAPQLDGNVDQAFARRIVDLRIGKNQLQKLDSLFGHRIARERFPQEEFVDGMVRQSGIGDALQHFFDLVARAQPAPAQRQKVPVVGHFREAAAGLSEMPERFVQTEGVAVLPENAQRPFGAIHDHQIAFPQRVFAIAQVPSHGNPVTGDNFFLLPVLMAQTAQSSAAVCLPIPAAVNDGGRFAELKGDEAGMAQNAPAGRNHGGAAIKEDRVFGANCGGDKNRAVKILGGPARRAEQHQADCAPGRSSQSVDRRRQVPAARQEPGRFPHAGEDFRGFIGNARFRLFRLLYRVLVAPEQ